MLKSLLKDRHLSAGQPECLATQSSSLGIIKELIVITSSLLMALSSPDKSQSRLKTPSRVLVALAPYWAVVVFVTQIGGPHSAAEKAKLLSALRTLLTDSSVMESATLLTLDAAVVSEGFARSALTSVLHFAVQFVLAMRQSLERKILSDSLPMKFVSNILDLSDNNSLQLIQFILKHCPHLALNGDFNRAQALPLSYVVSCIGLLSCSPNHLSEESSSKALFDSLYVQLAQLFCQLAPECVGCLDKLRRATLHYACMNVSMPSVLSVILHALPCTAALMDAQGLYPINYLLQHSGRDEKLTMELFQVYPNAFRGLPLPTYVEREDKEIASSPAADTDNESLSGSSLSSAPATPLSVDCDVSEDENACMLQHAASLLLLKRAQSASFDSLSSRKRRLKSSEQAINLPVTKRARRKA
ncbi:hypothetical protein EON65_32235 [archaeon]|nr:MAG: hypothetical protein EON65_32235 [archaeon]